MKYLKIFTILLFSSFIALSSCNDKKSDKAEETDAEKAQTPTEAVTTPEIAVNTGDVYHYTCPQGCAGGADSAINCTNCGTLLVHNQDFHNQPDPNQSSSPIANPPAEPSQNAAGVWHYICESGCAGGAGAAGNCSVCGNALIHNSAYH